MELLSPFFNFAILYTIILGLGALSGYASEKVGIMNLGIDGMMIAGAMFFGILSKFTAPLGTGSVFLTLILCGLVSTSIGALHGLATIVLKTDHVISGFAINILLLGMALFLNVSLGDALYNKNSLVSAHPQFEHVGSGFYMSSVYLLIVAAIFVIILYLVMHYTRFGLRYRGVGENPNAIDSQGISVKKYQWTGVLLSGFIAGVAGGVYLFSNSSFNGTVQGLGFMAMAIMISGQWDIIKISLTSLAFAGITALVRRDIFSTIAGTNAYNNIWEILPFALTILALVFTAKKSRAPKNVGKHFDKSLR